MPVRCDFGAAADATISMVTEIAAAAAPAAAAGAARSAFYFFPESMTDADIPGQRTLKFRNAPPTNSVSPPTVEKCL